MSVLSAFHRGSRRVFKFIFFAVVFRRWAVVRVAGHLLPFVLAIVCMIVLFQRYQSGEQVRALPVLLGSLCLIAIAYRYYSAFLAAKVAALDDSIPTPAHQFNDGQNYHPTNKWVLFGHHFAAISGAGPLIGQCSPCNGATCRGCFGWSLASVSPGRCRTCW